MRIVYLVGLISLLSCEPVEDNNQGQRIELDDGTSIAKTDSSSMQLKFNIIKKYHGMLNDSNCGMTEIEHDGCRYLFVEGYGETLAFIHKPNCQNSYHIK